MKKSYIILCIILMVNLTILIVGMTLLGGLILRNSKEARVNEVRINMDLEELLDTITVEAIEVDGEAKENGLVTLNVMGEIFDYYFEVED